MSDHVVDPVDERRHTPDPDGLWNESYYADFVQADGSWGGWLRLGLYPNRQVAWWTTWIVGPGRDGVCSVNYTVPVPAGDGLVAEDADTRIEIDLVDPLRAFRLAASAPAEVYGKPEAVYDGEAGKPTTLEVDLTWRTDGSPYHYELTTRYEIPCLVSGTVRIGDEVLTADGHGQRDHSWGVRDWWAFGWCWSSGRLNDDGTRVHLADIRMPGFPVAFGYVQHPDGATVDPVERLAVTEDLGAHGFPDSARIEIAGGSNDIGIAVSPLAFGPVLLVDDEGGRTSRFPRALVRYVADDGRAGHGWIEWNQPDPA
ncbi:MAG TPA: hypothetical protein VGF87_06005 [Acidimicrobiales bacterium]|jgi:hypothetical protein